MGDELKYAELTIESAEFSLADPMAEKKARLELVNRDGSPLSAAPTSDPILNRAIKALAEVING